MDVAVAWSEIETWMSANARSVWKSLRPPADDTAIEKLQKKLKLTLPADFVESVRIHDGQKPTAEHGIIPGPPDELGDVASYQLLPLKDIGSVWLSMKELLDMGEFEGRKVKPSRGIQNVWWSAGWVPFADNGGGDFICLDLDPGKGGVIGQVILFGHEGTDQRRVGKSYAEWFSKLARGFKSGKYTLDEDEGLIEA